MSGSPASSPSPSLLGEAKFVSSNSGKLPSATTTPSKPILLEKFTLFPKLPLELQDMVWSYTTADLPPRIIEVEYSPLDRKIIAKTLSPPLLHACFSSRKAALKKYDPLSFGYFSGTHVNWERDTILLNIHNAIDFYFELKEINCTDLYQKCKRLIINDGGSTPARTFLEVGDTTRPDEEWIDVPNSPPVVPFAGGPLFSYFKVLQEVGVTYLGKIPKGEGNLRVEMASDDVRRSSSGCATPRPGSAKCAMAQLGATFPSQRLVDQTVKTVTTIRVVKLKRGKEKKMTVRAKMRKNHLAKMKKVEEFRRAKKVLDQEYEDNFEEFDDDDDDGWGEVEMWAESIPAGPDSWPEDWAAALSDFWA